jgi:hypothetical protein
MERKGHTSPKKIPARGLARGAPNTRVAKDGFDIVRKSSSEEELLRNRFITLFRECPIPDNELMLNLGLFLSRQALSRIMFMHELYKKIIPVHGIIVEFGVRWGQNLALFSAFRGMYEPYNYTRKIVGFDTFSGFPKVSEKDGHSDVMKEGAYSVTANYEKYLEEVLDYHEKESPIPHIRKYEVVRGDATVEIERYLERHPETIIALAYFDFDLYLPTKKCLGAIQGHLTRGSVIGFDELNCHEFPGETISVKEVLGLDRYPIRRDPSNPTASYIVI